jgi:hypothetical protein
MDPLRYYREVVVGDFEFGAPVGGVPEVRCGVFHEVHSGVTTRLWLDDRTLRLPPFGTDKDCLFVAYFACAEMSCFLQLGWQDPRNLLDLFAEYCREISGLPGRGRKLLNALDHYQLPRMAVSEKEEMRRLALRGGPYTGSEKQALLNYCEEDVQATVRLLFAMLPDIDLPRALLRGRFMPAVAKIERAGVPIDVDLWSRLRANWEAIKAHLVAAVDEGLGVYVPSGSRDVNPDSRLGSALLEAAAAHEVDPRHLWDVVDYLWEEERAAHAEVAEAVRAARKATGLTPRKCLAWEQSGYNYSTVPHLDVLARHLAGEYPALGIGPGYAAADVYEMVDHAGRLWERLRVPDPRARPKWDAGLLREAAEMVLATPEDDLRPSGPMRFSEDRFADYLVRHGCPWPRLESGRLALDDETFRLMAKAYPDEVGPLRELRHVLSQLKLRDLAVGPDGRNRCLLSPFGSKTGRNQPSNAKYIFGPSVFLRSLIRPSPGRAVAYLDWSQQELAIAAYLSNDPRMKEAYATGDFYLTFAKMAGAVPPDATAESHRGIRDQFKVLALGVLYGLSARGLALRLDEPLTRGRDLLDLHRQVFPTYWEWSDRVETEAMMFSELETCFGWKVHVPPGFDPSSRRPLANPRSLRNFMMQATGAEMMRIGCILATERGHTVCAVVHDALLIEVAEGAIDGEVAAVGEVMREASELVLPGFPLRTEAKTVRYPDRYSDKRGQKMWDTVLRVLACIEERRADPTVRGLVRELAAERT